MAFRHALDIEHIIPLEDELLRAHVLLLAAQVSTSIVQKFQLPMTQLPRGGIMQSVIANLALSRSPRYVVSSQQMVRVEPSHPLSPWFMDSTLFGVDLVYHHPIMNFSDHTAGIIGENTCKFGLKLLLFQKFGLLTIDYPLTLRELKSQLEQHYKSRFRRFRRSLRMLELAHVSDRASRLIGTLLTRSST
jgi:hypothetical protein